MSKIPKIIHQIWSGIDEPLPRPFQILGDTWKRDYADWKYEFWDNERINNFILEYYPQHWDIYNKFSYNIQRWDAIRYLILDKIGGMYVDFDYESIKSMEDLLKNKTCCFAIEKRYSPTSAQEACFFNNALMLSVPDHPFMKKIIENVFSDKMQEYKKFSKIEHVFYTTGPRLLVGLYENLTDREKKDVYLIPAKYVSPFTGEEAMLVRTGTRNEKLEDCLDEAYAVHYFCSNWVTNNL
ncbi:glycosyltransferase family 32 protein [Dysgonomonas sp. ZJ709]|uniref:glycosyltransferase family 32 protein n=1 Tax=Dysgonomonas sp. ZJ709 TaxID=2709797 RepID=UPI0013EDA593|nr:glycosyltransferase [Dysgonomonas sp. ZJ709]